MTVFVVTEFVNMMVPQEGDVVGVFVTEDSAQKCCDNHTIDGKTYCKIIEVNLEK